MAKKPPLTLLPVKGSSQIAAQKYNPVTEELIIQFHNEGRVYLYKGISPEEYDVFMDAESLGSHWNKVKGKYKYTQLHGFEVKYA